MADMEPAHESAEGGLKSLSCLEPIAIIDFYGNWKRSLLLSRA